MLKDIFKYKKVTILFFILLLVWGALSFFSLSKRENPEIDVTLATIQTVYPGAAPKEVEREVTIPLEKKISEINDIKNIRSRSSANVSFIDVELKTGVDKEAAFRLLREKVEEAEGDFPEDVSTPEVNDDLAIIAERFVHFTSDSEENLENIRALLEDGIDRLELIDGVKNVDLVGLPDREVQIKLDFDELEEKKIPWTLVSNKLNEKYNTVPLGELNNDDQSKMLYIKNHSTSPDELKDVVISVDQTGDPILLSDLAEISIGSEEKNESISYNGRPAVDLVINAEEGVDIPSLSQAIEGELTQLSADLPENIDMSTPFTQSNMVEAMFLQLGKELALGILSVLLVSSIGLSLGSALMVALSLPFSLIISFIGLGWFGVDLNQVTIASFIIVIGFLVDDAIVVNENIERRLALGDQPKDAVYRGSKEVALSIFTASTVTVAAFLPLFLLESDIGDFIKAIPVVATLNIIASYIVAITVLPIIRMKILESMSKKSLRKQSISAKFFQKLSNSYKQVLKILIKKPLLTSLITILLASCSFLLIPKLNIELFPKVERDEVLIDVTMPAGTSFDKTEDVISEAASYVRDQDEVDSVSAYSGRTTPKFYYNELEDYGENVGQLFVELRTERQDDTRLTELLKNWRTELQGILPEDMTVNPRELEQGPPIGVPIDVRITGSDIATLQDLSDQVQDDLHNIDGAINIRDTIEYQENQLEIEINEEEMAKQDVSEQAVTSTIRLVTQGVEIGTIYEHEQAVDVTLYSQSQQLKDLLVPSNQFINKRVNDLTTEKTTEEISTLNRFDQQPSVNVHAYAEGRYASEIANELKPKLQEINLPKNYQIELSGADEETEESFKDIGNLFLVVMLLIFIILVMQFYSIRMTLLILVTVYLAASGAVLGLFFTSTPIGFMALLGIVSLAGIVVRNGIIFVEFIEQEIKSGKSKMDAVVNAGKMRIRPIVLTAATTVVALIPMAVMGGSLWRPLAITIISGLVFSTILTLIIVPTFYLLLSKKKHKKLTRMSRRVPTIEK